MANAVPRSATDRRHAVRVIRPRYLGSPAKYLRASALRLVDATDRQSCALGFCVVALARPPSSRDEKWHEEDQEDDCRADNPPDASGSPGGRRVRVGCGGPPACRDDHDDEDALDEHQCWSAGQRDVEQQGRKCPDGYSDQRPPKRVSSQQRVWRLPNPEHNRSTRDRNCAEPERHGEPSLRHCLRPTRCHLNSLLDRRMGPERSSVRPLLVVEVVARTPEARSANNALVVGGQLCAVPRAADRHLPHAFLVCGPTAVRARIGDFALDCPISGRIALYLVGFWRR